MKEGDNSSFLNIILYRHILVEGNMQQLRSFQAK